MILHLSKQIEATRVNRVKHYVMLSMTLSFLSEVVGLVSLEGLFTRLIIVIFWCGYYALLLRALKRMMYSFLTLQLVGLLIHSLIVLNHVAQNDLVGSAISGTNILLCLLIIYTVNRPIFFPKINWTEYDFRHRQDQRVDIIVGDKLESARLYDQRRGEAALLSFSDLCLDEDYEVMDQEKNILGVARILSQRRTLLGRPATFGIRLMRQK